MIESFSIAVRLLSIQNDKIANSMLEEYGMTNGQFKVLNLLYARPAFPSVRWTSRSSFRSPIPRSR